MIKRIEEQNEYFFNQAIKEAKKALCLKDKCGTVIVLNNEIIGKGYNAPPGDDIDKRRCGDNFKPSSKLKSYRTCCMHAEGMAILDAVINKKSISGSTLYFTRIDGNGNLKKSGKPYCTVCSRLALDSKIEYFGLWHENGIKLYNTKEYNDLSYDFHKND